MAAPRTVMTCPVFQKGTRPRIVSGSLSGIGVGLVRYVHGPCPVLCPLPVPDNGGTRRVPVSGTSRRVLRHMTLRLFPCRGSGQLVSPGPRCFRCRRAWGKAYDQGRPAHHAPYSTADWRRLSAEVRRRHPVVGAFTALSQPAASSPITSVPVEFAPELALERSNLVASCIPCNTRRGRNAKLPDLVPAKGRAA